MNATRAATIRLRSSFDGAVSLGRVQTPTLAILARREQEIRDFTPEPYWVVDAAFDTVENGPRPYEGRYHAGAKPRVDERRGGRSGRRRLRGPDGRDHEAREDRAQGALAAALRPHLASARRQQPLRVLRPPHAGRGPAALRGAQGAHLPADQQPLHHRRHDRRDQADRPARRLPARVRPGIAVRARARRAAARPGRQRRQGHRPPRDHPHPRRAPSGRQVLRRRPAHLRPRRAPLPRRSSTPMPCSRTPGWRRRSPATCSAPEAS